MSNKFSDVYVDQAFHIWYDNNRIGMKRLVDLVPKDITGKIPTKLTLENWKKEYGWEERADALDGEASFALDQEVIQKRIKMWERLETVGDQLITKGEKYLKDHDFEETSDAIRAVVEGAKMIQASVGQAQAWAKIGNMSDGQINQAIRKLIGKANGGTVLDMESEDDVLGEIIEEDAQ